MVIFVFSKLILKNNLKNKNRRYPKSLFESDSTQSVFFYSESSFLRGLFSRTHDDFPKQLVKFQNFKMFSKLC